MFVILGRNTTFGRKATSGHSKAAFTLRNISTSSHDNKVSNIAASGFAFLPGHVIVAIIYPSSNGASSLVFFLVPMV